MRFFLKLFRREMSRSDVWLTAYSTSMRAQNSHEWAMKAADEVLQRIDSLR